MAELSETALNTVHVAEIEYLILMEPRMIIMFKIIFLFPMMFIASVGWILEQTGKGCKKISEVAGKIVSIYYDWGK